MTSAVNSGDRKLYAALLAAFILATQLLLFVSASRSMPQSAIDYRTYYAAGLMMRSGEAHQLYDDAYEARTQRLAAGPRTTSLPFLYPPFAALLFVPLTWMSYGTSVLVFRVINLILTAGSAHLLTRIAGLPRGATWLVWALVVGFNPVCFTLLQDQVSLLLLLLVCAAELAMRRHRPVVAGLILAGMLIKFNLALPMLFLFLLWRRWSILKGFLVGGTVLASVSAMLVGGAGLLAYCRSAAGMEHRVAAGVPDYGSLLVKMPNLYGLANLLYGSGPLCMAVTGATSVALIGWAATRRCSLSVALLVAILVSYHLLAYDLTLLLLPIAVSARIWLHQQGARDSRMGRVYHRTQVIITCLLLLPPAYLIVESGQVMCLIVLPMLLLSTFLASRRTQAPALAELPCTGAFTV